MTQTLPALALAILLATAIQAATVGPELVTNGGFEQTSGDGAVLGWPVPDGIFTVDRAQAGTNGACLGYSNSDTSIYQLCRQPLPLQAGRRYQFGGRIRNGTLLGGVDAARIAIEWYRGGRWVGGQYVTLPQDAVGWQSVSKVTPVMPVEADSYALLCFMERGAAGTALWDDITVQRYQGDLLTDLRTDAYRDAAAGGLVTVLGRLFAGDYDDARSQLELRLQVLAADGAVAAETMDSGSSLTEASWTFDATPLAAGSYTLHVTARVPSTGTTSTLDHPFQRLAAPLARTVSFDRLGRTLVNGQPFFPLGTYWSGVAQADLDLYRASPFNCLMPYSSMEGSVAAQTAWLDACQAAGLKVIFSVKDTFLGAPFAPTVQAGRDALLAAVHAHKDHPALLAWYTVDEEPIGNLAEMILHYGLVRGADANHPCWEVFYQNDLIERSGSYDVLGTDAYPVRDHTGALDVPLRMAQTTADAARPRPVWMVPQAHNLSIYGGVGVPPSRAEMRSMAWQCIAGGANGLVFYSFFDLHRDPAATFPARWSDLTAVGQELKARESMLLAEPAPAGLVTAPIAAESAWRAYLLDGDLHLMVVNATRVTASSSYTFDRALRPAATLLGRTISGGSSTFLTLDLLPLEVRIVRLSVYAAGDVNQDGAVNASDITLVRNLFGQSTPGISDRRADVDGNGTVDAGDLDLVLQGQRP